MRSRKWPVQRENGAITGQHNFGRAAFRGEFVGIIGRHELIPRDYLEQLDKLGQSL